MPLATDSPTVNEPLADGTKAPFYRRLQITPTAPPPAETLPLDEVRRLIMTSALEYLADPNPPGPLILAVNPGVGKTNTAVWLCEWLAAEYPTRRNLYIGPRHALYQDIQAEVAKMNGDPRHWYEWLPRQLRNVQAGKIETCQHTQQITAWMQRGYNPLTFCKNEHICGKAVIQHECFYHAQKRMQVPNVFLQHKHLTSGHVFFDTRCHVVIGDENPMDAFLRRWSIPAEWIVPPDMEPGPVKTFLDALQRLVANKTCQLSGKGLIDVLGGRETVAALLAEWTPYPKNIDIISPALRNPDDVSNAPYFYLPQLRELLARECAAIEEYGDSIGRIQVKEQSLDLLLRHEATAALPPHVIWLDATGTQPLYEALFQRPCTVIRPQVALFAEVYQVHDRANGISSLVDYDKQTGRTYSPRFEQLVVQIRHILTTKNYRAPVLMTFMAIEAELAARLQSQFPALQIEHFYNVRGTNKYQDCDGLIIAGCPLIPQTTILDDAAMLFFNRNQPFDSRWIVENLSYAWQGNSNQGAAYPVAQFADPQLNSLLFQRRQAELIQAAHRIRPAIPRADGSTPDIWLLTNIPLDGLGPSHLLSIKELFDAPPGIDAYVWPEIIRIAYAKLDEVGYVSSLDFMVALDIQRAAANRYMDAIMARYPADFPPLHIRVAGTGRPPKAAGTK